MGNGCVRDGLIPLEQGLANHQARAGWDAPRLEGKGMTDGDSPFCITETAG